MYNYIASYLCKGMAKALHYLAIAIAIKVDNFIQSHQMSLEAQFLVH